MRLPASWCACTHARCLPSLILIRKNGKTWKHLLLLLYKVFYNVKIIQLRHKLSSSAIKLSSSAIKKAFAAPPKRPNSVHPRKSLLLLRLRVFSRSKSYTVPQLKLYSSVENDRTRCSFKALCVSCLPG